MILPLTASIAFFISSVYGQKIHELMTKEEIQSVFSVTNDVVHEVDYEVVPLLLNKRNQRNNQVQFSAFNTNYDISLENNDQVLLGRKTRIFKVMRDSDGNISYKKSHFPNMENLQFGHNIKKRAAIMLYTDENNKTHAQGIIGDDIIIRSLPPRVHSEVISKYPNIIKGHHSYQSKHVNHHVVIRSAQQTAPTMSDERLNKQVADDMSHAANITDTVYPQLLLASDYGTYILHNSNINDLALYMAAFWNAVDLRFREMDSPMIRLNIAGLVVSTDPSITFMGNHPDNRCKDQSNALSAWHSMNSVGQYFGRDFLLTKTKYDITIGITNRDLCGGTKPKVYYGISFVGKACAHSTKQAAALVQDTGAFSRVKTATHEVAHSLGAPHDPSDDTTNKVDIGQCHWDDGYIMSYHHYNTNQFHFSQCSINSMRKFFKSKSGQCLRNKPDVGAPYPKILPGILQNREHQCQSLYKMPAYMGPDLTKANDCVFLYCGKDNPVKTEAPADGSSCGPNKICLVGECVNIPGIYG